MRGGALCRDVFENNLPGIIWMQAAVRAVLGWRYETLRLVDFGLMTLVVLLLLRWVPARGGCTPARIGTAAALAVFYLFTPENCHCQRDGWMLLPAVAALCLRDRQLRLIAAAAPGATVFCRAALEGLCWGAAVWIKPFVAVPAVACWLVGACSLRRARGLARLDAGGLLASGTGLSWLVASGAWHSFLEILLGWNREYANLGFGRATRPMLLLFWAK